MNLLPILGGDGEVFHEFFSLERCRPVTGIMLGESPCIGGVCLLLLGDTVVSVAMQDEPPKNQL